ncbi:Oidioi.mRNA.OKI2018_I69.chr2.g6307.t1.cds [Oikopleura dioica]|uniref:Oidioi.mRNA.OKI2018_I69.chr2.g6307.t1.cds n=1 Tax=Oikopleura dioica TaxID=34765 RepID=A0ABN7T8P4_OIKDI|nr:Oidioi.mRNA.OKI2018_I69.chr2.g6307.t1.cds [Oikopleura dioica]
MEEGVRKIACRGRCTGRKRALANLNKDGTAKIDKHYKEEFVAFCKKAKKRRFTHEQLMKLGRDPSDPRSIQDYFYSKKMTPAEKKLYDELIPGNHDSMPILKSTNEIRWAYCGERYSAVHIWETELTAMKDKGRIKSF